ncbi:P-loop containing nucleoside triphosphate hydrolase protein [Mycena alexandri]|uniref:P-loop containing nucleoside triphosphate hydrolase protein n=1 Tax=Mycena alexandri TaxID=1745969 RepID=A0AAD6RXJ8_9AGAR|nr:P-loop containing nucleoside triphosphate hydrolase protein [Mycena alexandri]
MNLCSALRRISIKPNLKSCHWPANYPRRCFSSTRLNHGELMAMEKMRNIAIIAHVDHGKTTLVDQLLRQSGTLKPLVTTPSAVAGGDPTTTTHTDRVMDSNDLERERGITILSKCTSVFYSPTSDAGTHLINIVDTPGHADFGGEVERILSMVDGVALVVDATEGPMTQTRFVLSKALARGLKPLIVLNKSDRPTSRIPQVESDLFDLFMTLGATDEQMEYPVLYASAKQGWAVTDVAAIPSQDPDAPPEKQKHEGMKPLFDMVLEHCPPPRLSRADDAPFSMITIQIENDPYVGTLYLGRVHSGVIRPGDALIAIDPEGNKVGDGRVKKLYVRVGMDRVERDEAAAGEIISIAGIKGGGVNVTLVSADEKSWPNGVAQPLPSTPIDPPTISVVVMANSGPLGGTEGTKLTSQVIKERIHREALTDVALRVLPGPTSDAIEVRGRGVLHLGILLENLRREGFELLVGPPKAVLLKDPDMPGGWLEPVEACTVVVREEYASGVVQKLTQRKGEMRSYDVVDEDVGAGAAAGSEGSGGGSGGWVRIEIDVPARGLIGYMAGEFGNDVHGQGSLNHTFKGYEPFKGPIETGRNGSLISMAQGEASAYSIVPLQARGVLFIPPGTQVYNGMVIGESSKALDMYVNPCLKKQLTNVRSAGADEKLVLASPKVMNMEESIAYMADDEMIEITPKSVRLRKAELDMNKRLKGMKGKGNRGGRA